MINTIPDVEAQALLGNRGAAIQVVSALRRYREAAQKLLSRRYMDGECDAHALSGFEGTLDEIEDELKEWSKNG